MRSLKDYLSAEVLKGDSVSLLKIVRTRLLSSRADALFLLRTVYVWRRTNKHKILTYLHNRTLERRYGIFIGSKAEIDIGLTLPHPHGIIVGEYAVLGKNVTLYQNTTIGGKKIHESGHSYPRIDDGCVLYDGVKVLGGIRVAENTVIGANSVLLCDSEKDSVYGGVPARRLK